MANGGHAGAGNHDDSASESQSQIEIMREVVEEAEKWSELLLRYSRSMLYQFIPATILAVGVTVAQLYWTLWSWGSMAESMRLANLLVLLLLAIVALLAVWKQAEAVIRYGANKGRHRKWHEKFDALREIEKSLEDNLLGYGPAT